MKRTLTLLLVVSLIVGIFSGLCITTKAAGEILLDNGDFEGSSYAPAGASDCNIELSATEYHSGSKSLKISNRTATWSGFTYDITDIIYAQGSGVYEASCWVKVVLPNGAAIDTANLYLSFNSKWSVDDSANGSGYSKGERTGTQNVGNSDGWVKLTARTTHNGKKVYNFQPLSLAYFTVRQDANQFATYHDFDIYIDDLELKKVSDIAEDADNKHYAAPKLPAINADGSATHADGKVYVNDPNIVYTGRWNTEYNTVYYSGWQGYVDIKFTGTTTLKAMGKYNNTTFGSEVYVDILDESGKSVLPVKNDNLGEVGRYLYLTENADLTFGAVTLDPNKIYTLRIIARWDVNRAVFQGVYMDKGAKTLPIEKAPAIEFIGDSISAGYISKAYTDGLANKSWTDSFTYRTGALLGWRTSTVARSGIAIADTTKDLMPVMYKNFTLIDKASVVDYSKQDLDYIVVNLGTNDLNLAHSDENREFFKTEYKKFIEYLLSVHPKATIFVMEPFSNADVYKFANEIKAVADEFSRVEFVETTSWKLNKTNPDFAGKLGADDFHLLPAGADIAAEKLAAVLEEHYANRHQVNINVNTTGEFDVNALNVLVDGKEVEPFVYKDCVSFYATKNSQVEVRFDTFGEYAPISIKYTGNKGQILGTDEYSFVARGNVTELTVDYVLEENSKIVKLFYIDGIGKQIVFDNFNVSGDSLERLNNYPSLYQKELKEFKIGGNAYQTAEQAMAAINASTESEILVEVIYQVKTEAQAGYSITNYPFMEATDVDGNVITSNVAPFAIVTFTAAATDGSKNFAYWIDENNNIISYNQVYTRYIIGNVDIKPVYTDAPVEKAAITLAIVENDQKLVVVAERSLDKNLEILEHGILIAEYITDDLTVEDVGENEQGKVYIGHRLSSAESVYHNGTYILSKGDKHSQGGTYSSKRTTLSCVAFVRYIDAQGNEVVKYSEIAQTKLEGPVILPDINYDEIQ